MNQLSKLSIFTLLGLTSTCFAHEAYQDSVLLSSPFPVYVKNNVVINHPVPGFVKKDLPTFNNFQGRPGCYILCYSHQKLNSIYRVGNSKIFAHGQIRVPGHYIGRTCQPKGYENQSIDKLEKFKTLCAQNIKSCGNNCWAGGDTGGWFGIQR